MADFVKATELKDLAPGSLMAVELDGKQIALANVDGRIYAFGGTCTHRGGPLAEGSLEGAVVTCPWHGGRFDVTTGDVVGPPPRENVPVNQAKVQGGGIEIAPST